MPVIKISELPYAEEVSNESRFPCSVGSETVSVSGEQLAVWNASNVPVGGDLSGTVNNAAVENIQGRPVSSLAPSAGQILKWSGVSWQGSADLAERRKITAVNQPTYTIQITDKIIVVDYTATAAVIITLPAASTAFVDGSGYWFVIKDGAANAAENNITIERAGTDLITDSQTGQTSSIIAVDGGAIFIQARSATQWIVY